MTETPEPRTEPTTVTPSPPRQDERKGPHWVFKLAAWVVIVAGIVFVFAVVFWTGLMIGAHGGGHHRHHMEHEGRAMHSRHWDQGPMGPMGPGQPGFAPPGITAPGGIPTPSTTPAPTIPARP
jgi:hypothetical protein